MTDLKERLRPLDGFHPRVSWEEVRGREVRAPWQGPAIAGRRRIVVIAAALAVSVGSIVWLSSAFPDPEPATTPAAGSDTYLFHDITVGPSPRHADRVAVGFRSSWSGAEYPGEHRCEFTVMDAAGAQVVRESVVFASTVPTGNDHSAAIVPGHGEPVAATITCSPERLDAPVAFEIVDVRLSSIDDAVLMTYRAMAPAGLVEPAYPGTNACTAWLELPGSWRSEHDFTLTAPSGSETDARFGEERVLRALDDGLFDQLEGGVDCHAFTAADVHPADLAGAGG